jgi:hypothetical protein
MKSFINVLLITITLGLATHVQADTIQNEGLSQTQLRNDPMAAFAATENLGVPLTAVEADGMRGEVWQVYVVWKLFKSGLTSLANYTAEKYGLDIRFSPFSPLCAGEDC